MFYFPHLVIKLAGWSSSFSAETESPQLVRAVFPHQLDLFFCISQVCFSTPENHRNLVPEFHILVDYKVSTIWYFPKLAKLGYFQLFPLVFASFPLSFSFCHKPAFSLKLSFLLTFSLARPFDGGTKLCIKRRLWKDKEQWCYKVGMMV